MGCTFLEVTELYGPGRQWVEYAEGDPTMPAAPTLMVELAAALGTTPEKLATSAGGFTSEVMYDQASGEVIVGFWANEGARLPWGDGKEVHLIRTCTAPATAQLRPSSTAKPSLPGERPVPKAGMGAAIGFGVVVALLLGVTMSLSGPKRSRSRV